MDGWLAGWLPEQHRTSCEVVWCGVVYDMTCTPRVIRTTTDALVVITEEDRNYKSVTHGLHEVETQFHSQIK